MLTYSELLKNRRSIRDYQDKEVSMEIIDEILHDTCLAPSASNTQPWNFIVVNNRKMMERISDESKKNILKDIESNPGSNHKRYQEMLQAKGFNVFYNAPCLILIVGKNNYNHFVGDCALAVAYMMFAAIERGLGTCWIGLGAYIKDKKIRDELNLSDEYDIAAPIILGYPVVIPEVSLRREPQIIKIFP
jgi:nitroreductase